MGNTFTTSVVQRTSQVSYACLPFNYFGDGQTVVIVVEVYCKYSFSFLCVLVFSLKQPVTMQFYWKEEKESLSAKEFVRFSLF